MDRWLRDGPALPAAPEPGDPGETWWTCSAGGDDHHCWWPGPVPAWATARMVRVWHGRLCLSSGIERLRPAVAALPLPACWPDIRAGLGWNWGLSTTQLHSNAGVGVIPLPGDPTRGTVTGNRSDPLAVILRMTADLRWNVRGFAGLRVRLTGLSRQPAKLSLLFTAQRGNSRPQQSLSVPLDADGWVCIDRLPAGLAWAETTRIDLGDIPGPRFILGPIERLPTA